MKNSKVRRRTSPSNESDRLSEIYQVAAQIICEKGYDATSMDDIADAVGITKAGIYHYIHGKGEMLFQIMSYGMDRLDRHVIIPAREIRDPEARLRAIIRSHALLIAAGSNNKGNNPITIVTDEVAGLAPAHRRAIEKRKRVYLDLVRETLRELKDQKKLSDVDITVAAFSLFGVMLWLSRWYRPNGRLTREEAANQVSKIALGGLLASRKS
jgi:AcrR family transcriptional regulator